MSLSLENCQIFNAYVHCIHQVVNNDKTIPFFLYKKLTVPWILEILIYDSSLIIDNIFLGNNFYLEDAPKGFITYNRNNI